MNSDDIPPALRGAIEIVNGVVVVDVEAANVALSSGRRDGITH